MTRAVHVFLAMTFAAVASAQTVIDRVVARVGDDSIFSTDVRAAVGLGVVELSDSPDPDEAALEGLIERRLMLKEIFRGTTPEPDAEAVEEEVRRMKSYAAATLKTVMTANGVDDALLHRFARDTLRIQLYLDTRFPRVDVNDDEARQYYRAHPDAFRRNGEMMTFEQATAAAHELASRQRRDARIDQWIEGLRRRTQITRPVSAPAGSTGRGREE